MCVYVCICVCVYVYVCVSMCLRVREETSEEGRERERGLRGKGEGEGGGGDLQFLESPTVSLLPVLDSLSASSSQQQRSRKLSHVHHMRLHIMQQCIRIVRGKNYIILL